MLALTTMMPSAVPSTGARLDSRQYPAEISVVLAKPCNARPRRPAMLMRTSVPSALVTRRVGAGQGIGQAFDLRPQGVEIRFPTLGQEEIGLVRFRQHDHAHAGRVARWRASVWAALAR